jgi:hypothetical protein
MARRASAAPGLGARIWPELPGELVPSAMLVVLISLDALFKERDEEAARVLDILLAAAASPAFAAALHFRANDWRGMVASQQIAAEFRRYRRHRLRHGKLPGWLQLGVVGLVRPQMLSQSKHGLECLFDEPQEETCRKDSFIRGKAYKGAWPTEKPGLQTKKLGPSYCASGAPCYGGREG